MTLKPDPDPETQTVAGNLANPTGPMCGLTRQPQPATGPVMGGAIPAAVNWRVYTALPPASSLPSPHDHDALTMTRRAELLSCAHDIAVRLDGLHLDDDAKAFIRSALALVLE